MKYYLAVREKLAKEIMTERPGAASPAGRAAPGPSAGDVRGEGPRQEPGKPGKPPSTRPSGGFPGFPGSARVAQGRAGNEPGHEPKAEGTVPLATRSGSDHRDAPWWAELQGWPDNQREAWEERAAVMEYDAGLDREVAERKAFDDVATRFGLKSLPAQGPPVDPADPVGRIERWLLWNGFTEVDPAELDSFVQLPLPLLTGQEKDRPWRCESRYCLHKGRWWRSVHGVTNCRNCCPPAFPHLVAETGDHDPS